jgi:hypothetical protein
MRRFNRSRSRAFVAPLVIVSALGLLVGACGGSAPSAPPSSAPVASLTATPSSTGPSSVAPASSAPSSAQPSSTGPTTVALDLPQRQPGRSIYDLDGVFRAATVSAVERDIEAIRSKAGVDIVVVTYPHGSAVTTDQAQADASQIMERWAVGGPTGLGLVILFDLDTTKLHGQVQLFGGDALRTSLLSNAQRQTIFDGTMLPLLKSGDLDGALIAGIAKLKAKLVP